MEFVDVWPHERLDAGAKNGGRPNHTTRMFSLLFPGADKNNAGKKQKTGEKWALCCNWWMTFVIRRIGLTTMERSCFALVHVLCLHG